MTDTTDMHGDGPLTDREMIAEARKLADTFLPGKWPDTMNTLASALEAAIKREGRYKDALQEVDANTPTQGFVVTLRSHLVRFDYVSFVDLQQALANIGNIARSALVDAP